MVGWLARVERTHVDWRRMVRAAEVRRVSALLVLGAAPSRAAVGGDAAGGLGGAARVVVATGATARVRGVAEHSSTSDG